ncbi:MAG: cobyrinate a,c-diamide synthase [Rhodospirillales bacterium]|nr:cobyrinate a,c-diamide synthase [Rhodospirillales bacterium]
MAHFLVSATHKSSGKTTVSLGVCAALARMGHAVQPFKKGPDFIDPMWLSAASARTCHNLDFNTMPNDEILGLFARHSQGARTSVIEGNNGLFDGTDIEGGNSNAAMAKLLGAPVLLVVDCAGMARGVAPLLMGYEAFDADLRIGGVILNNVASTRHETKLRAAVERYCDIPVIGAVRRDHSLRIAERHLGLVPTEEWGQAKTQIDAAADAIAEQIDLDALLAMADVANLVTAPPSAPPTVRPADVRIGVARDSAFAFYYPGDLEAMRAAGAELVTFSPLHDTALPDIDGLFIGGGFPETHLSALEANASLREEIRNAIENGLPTYAECGGLMYLARNIEWQGMTGEMVGVIPAHIVVGDKPRGHGLVRLRETGAAPWPRLTENDPPVEICAHEFHYSDVGHLDGDTVFAYEVARGYGTDGRSDGIVYKNMLASYAHLRDTTRNHWTARFVEFVRSNIDR